MTDILPCPFCGGPAEVLESVHKVACLNQGCQAIVETRGCNTKDEAVQLWNRRYPQVIRKTMDDFVRECMETDKIIADLGKQSDASIQDPKWEYSPEYVDAMFAEQMGIQRRFVDEWFGARCDTFDPDCTVCKMWQAQDSMESAYMGADCTTTRKAKA